MTGPDRSRGRRPTDVPPGTDAVVVSVIIPAKDAAATIGAQLDALTRQEHALPWEVVVVDNGSSDATAEVCRSYRTRMPLRLGTCARPGTSATRNVGADLARGSKLLFCDADDEVGPRWVEAMARALDEHDAVGGRVDDLKLNGPLAPRHPDGLPVVAGFLPRTISANLGVRRDVWDTVGGFAEDYEYGSDDTEFCWRLQLAGHTLGYAPDAVVHYRHRTSLRAVAVKAFRTGRSRGRLFREYGPRGMPRPNPVGALARWARILLTAPVAVLRPRTRRWWVDQAGAAAGRVVGSAQFRVLYL